jgi:malate permease and related proteins
MLERLLPVFVEVVAPVFAIVALAYCVGPRLQIDVRTLSRVSYHVFVPAFTFDVISRSAVPLGRAARVAAYVAVLHLAFAATSWAVARLLRRSREVSAAFVMLGVFGNVGNYGLALVQFRLGPEALAPATIYFVASLIVSFVVCVGAAARVRGGGLAAVTSVLRTPALVVAVPAFVVSAAGVKVPLPIARGVGLLGAAMIPVMLFTLGLQLAEARALRPTRDVTISSVLRLVLSPAAAALLAPAFGVGGIDRAAAILQAGMPAAVLVGIIATEYDVAPAFVMTTVFWSTVLSLPVLTVLLSAV